VPHFCRRIGLDAELESVAQALGVQLGTAVNADSLRKCCCSSRLKPLLVSARRDETSMRCAKLLTLLSPIRSLSSKNHQLRARH
jgi:hypothetical protein